MYVAELRLRFFGHVARSLPNEDQHCSVTAAIQKRPRDWKRPVERPRQILLCRIEADKKHLVCKDECNHSGELAICCGHGVYVREEDDYQLRPYAIE